MADYSRFLSKTSSVVLPYFGGTRVDAEGRRYHVSEDLDPGWWQFEIRGRQATKTGPGEPGDLSGRPAVRGHFACGWLFSSGSETEPFALPPDEEPEPFAPCIGRRWYGGELLFDSVEFEDSAEMDCRLALENGTSLVEIKGVSPGLRAAFGYAVAHAVAQGLGSHVSPRETARHVMDIADWGRPAADQLVRRIEVERHRHRERIERQRAEAERLAAMTEDQRRVAELARQVRPIPRSARENQPAARADRALDAAGARLLRCRSVRAGLEVTFMFMGERFISLVDTRSLRVIDAGICLSGTDDRLTLESLPSAIREAIDTGALYITRQ